MVTNKPYLWLGWDAVIRKHILQIAIKNDLVISLQEIQQNAADKRLTLIYYVLGNPASPKTVDLINGHVIDASVSNISFSTTNHKKITVIFKNSTGTTTYGICTVFTDYPAPSTTPGPCIWLKFIDADTFRIYFKDAITNTYTIPPPSSVVNVTCATGAAIDLIQLNSGNYDPDITNYIDITVTGGGAGAGEATTCDSEGDASGGGLELLRSFVYP